MDFSYLWNLVHRFKIFSGKLASSSKNHPNPAADPETLKFLRGAVYMVFALLLGWFAKTETELHQRNQVLLHEWPPVRVLHALFKDGGWSLAEPELAHSLLGTHPDPFGREPMIWISEDHCYIFFHSPSFEPGNQEEKKTEFWTCALNPNKKPRKIRWKPLGTGYEGMNRLAGIQLHFPKKPVSYIDPKEIRY